MNDIGELTLEPGFPQDTSKLPGTAILRPRREREDWPRRLRRAEASRYLDEVHGVKTAKATLAKLAVVGSGPEYELWGRITYYPTELLDRWVEARLSPRRSTSDCGSDAQRSQSLSSPEGRRSTSDCGAEAP